LVAGGSGKQALAPEQLSVPADLLDERHSAGTEDVITSDDLQLAYFHQAGTTVHAWLSSVAWILAFAFGCRFQIRPSLIDPALPILPRSLVDPPARWRRWQQAMVTSHSMNCAER